MDQITSCCTRCGRPIVFGAGASVQCCMACGCLNERPRAQGPTLDLLRRATEQRLRCDFANAENSYQHVLLDYPDEHEALWGLALCRYGVEYVDDPQTGKRLPVVHGVRKKPLQTDSDFEQACEAASADVRAQYEAEAEYIDNAMHRIRELAETCPPFDVFICHKTTKPGSDEYTEDYNRAFKLYHMLDKLGYRAFFAPMEMEGVAAGSDYEAGICHALETAKVMLVVCSDAEYLKSPWVRNEWRRFLEMADGGADKCLLPLMYGEFLPAQLPRDFRVRKLQTVIMGEMGSAEKVLAVVRSYAGAGMSIPVHLAFTKFEVEQPEPEQPEPEQPEPEQPEPEQPESEQPEPEQPEPEQPEPEQPEPEQPEPEQPESEQLEPEQPEPEQPDVETPEAEQPEIEQAGEQLVYAVVPDQELLDQQDEIGQNDEAGPDSETVFTIQLEERLNAEAIAQPISAGDLNVAPVLCLQEEAYVTRPLKDGCIITKYTGPGGDVIIPPLLCGQRVITIGKEAFSGCDELTSVVIPANVRAIQQSAFFGCNKLKTVDIPHSVRFIGVVAFGECRALTSITIDEENGNYRMRDGMLISKDGVLIHALYMPEQTVRVVPDGVTDIAGYVFMKHTGITQIYLPDSVKSIGMFAFAGCMDMEKIMLHRSITHIDDTAFLQCPKLTMQVYENSCAQRYAAEKGLRYVVIPGAGSVHMVMTPLPEEHVRANPAEARIAAVVRNSDPTITTYGDYEIRKDSQARGCVIVRYLGNDENVEIPSVINGQKVIAIGRYAFGRNEHLTSITIPATVRCIGNSAFIHCINLASVSLPDSLEIIEYYAFAGCTQMQRIEIPDTVRHIGEYAFSYCSKLPFFLKRKLKNIGAM